MDAITLAGEPGDVLYWPSDYWHIGEDAGELSLAISLQIFKDFRLGAHLLSHAAGFVEQRLRKEDTSGLRSFSLDRPRESMPAIPKLVKLATRTLQAASRDADLEQTLKVAWLRHITGCGFYDVPAPLPHTALSRDDLVRGDSANPILWLRARHHEILCAANGHSSAIAAHPNILSLIECLNTGEPTRVKRLINRYAGNADRGGVRFEATAHDLHALLERLCSLRAVGVVDNR